MNTALYRLPIALLFPLLLLSTCKVASPASGRTTGAGEYYELRCYHLRNETQRVNVDHYLRQAFLPALHRAGWKNIGVFQPIESDTAHAGKYLFVLIPAPSLATLAGIPQALQNDSSYAQAGTDYQLATNDHPAYERMEISWLSAFKGSPRLQTPGLPTPRSERVYELRSYESATENLHQNKVRMFNEADEIGLFKKLGFQAVFYASVLTGAHMPNLVYMISFDNLAARDAHWKAFLGSPEWKHMTALPEYREKNVSHIDSYLLHPTGYSDY